MRNAPLLFALAGALGAACASPPPSPPEDAAVADAGHAPPDAGAVDAGPAAPSEPTDEQILATEWAALEAAPRINGKQDDLYFVTPELGWSVNGEGNIYRTDDGGQSWTHLLEQPGTPSRARQRIGARAGSRRRSTTARLR